MWKTQYKLAYEHISSCNSTVIVYASLTLLTVYWTVYFSLTNTVDRRSDLVAAVTEGFAGHVGGQTVEDQISTGGTGGDGAVIGIKGHTGHLFFMLLRDRGRLQTFRTVQAEHCEAVEPQTQQEDYWKHFLQHVVCLCFCRCFRDEVYNMFIYHPVLAELSPWGSGAVSWSSGPRCERSDQDLHWPETETTNSDTHGFVFSERMIAKSRH